MRKDFTTIEESASKASGVPEMPPEAAFEDTRPLHKRAGRDKAPAQAQKEKPPESELPKELAEVVQTVSRIIGRINSWEKMIKELQQELNRLRTERKIQILTPNIYASLGPVPFLSGKLINLATRLKTNPHQLPTFEFGLLVGNEKEIGQLEILKSAISMREQELTKLKLDAGIVREDILGDLEKGGSSAQRKEFVARLIRDFQAVTSEKILRLLEARVDLEKTILQESEAVVNQIREYFASQA